MRRGVLKHQRRATTLPALNFLLYRFEARIVWRLGAWAEGRVQALTHSSKACDSDRLCAATESPTDVEQFWALGGGGYH